MAAADGAVAALFAGWLDAAFGWRGRVVPELTEAASGAPLESVRLEGESCRIELRLLPNSTCLSTEGHVTSTQIASRVISLGDQTLPALVAEELRVRARDIAFERAVQRALAARA